MGVQFADKAIDNSPTQSFAAAGNSDSYIEQRLQLLVPRGFALWRELALLDFLIFPTGTETLRIPAAIDKGAH